MKTFAATIAVLTAITLTGCNGADGKPDVKPAKPTSTTATTNPGPPVKPPPKAPKLTDKQKADYRNARDRYDMFEDFIARVSEDPADYPVRKFTTELALYTSMPATKMTAVGWDNLRAKKQRFEGRRKVEWDHPVKITVDRVIFDRCESPGTLMVYQGEGKNEKSSPQTNNIRTRIYLALVEGQWRLYDQKIGREC